jgi:plasmid stabilization system protein ParE
VTYRVVFTVRARADVIEPFRYLADRSPDAAARWYTGIERAIAKLSKMPERHPIAPDETEQLGITLRQMLYGRRPGVVRILFSIQDNTVTLHYVRHSARGPHRALMAPRPFRAVGQKPRRPGAIAASSFSSDSTF